MESREFDTLKEDLSVPKNITHYVTTSDWHFPSWHLPAQS